jgi:hypothetical protein
MSTANVTARVERLENLTALGITGPVRGPAGAV